MTDPLLELRKAFPPKKVGKLPRITCQACSKKNCQAHKPTSCTECGNYITPKHIHLDYVGHAEVTRKLLDADPRWTYEPVAFADNGLPALDAEGGLWIRLTVHDQDGNPITRLGYGDAPGKRGAMKELIGDAIRNAAMRFGVALDLWSKERDDYIAEEGQPPAPPPPPKTYAQYLEMVVTAPDKTILMDVGNQIARADLQDAERAELRKEFNERLKTLTEVAA